MHSLRNFFAQRRALFGFWVLLCAITLIATARLTIFMVDATQRSYSALPNDEFMTKHSCFSAYVAAADRLGEPGARIYDPANYPRNGDDAQRRIHLGFFEQDQYEYPPTFLLLPKTFLLASHDFSVLRTLWYVFVTAVVLTAMGLTARWVGGREGLSTALLIPLFWVAIPNLIVVQTGNAQVIVYAMAIGAMMAFDRGRTALGGALLAFAIGAKLSPGVFLVFLLVQRRFREALYTAAFGALYCLAVLAIGGVAPFHEFLTFQLPRLMSGEAFSFLKETFQAKILNNSIFAFPYKLELLGLVHAPDRIAPIVSRIYLLALVALTVLFARKAGRSVPAPTSEERATRVVGWMAILNLAIMQAPFMPSYGLLGTVWMMTLWAPLGRSFWRSVVLFGVGWLSLMVVVPKPPSAQLVMSFITPLANLGINLGALWYTLRQRPQVEEQIEVATPAALAT